MYARTGRPTTEERRKFRDLLQFEDVYVPYREVEHPTYGTVLVGGTTKYASRVTPPWLLQEGCHRNFAFTMYHADQMPSLAWGELEVKPLGAELRQVTIEVKNDKLIPTILAHARSKRIGARDRLVCTPGPGTRVAASGTVSSLLPTATLEAVERDPRADLERSRHPRPWPSAVPLPHRGHRLDRARVHQRQGRVDPAAGGAGVASGRPRPPVRAQDRDRAGVSPRGGPPCTSRRSPTAVDLAAGETLRVIVITVAILGLARVAAAGEVTLQNDSGAGEVVCPCFVADEQVAAWLTSPCRGTLVEVQIGWGSFLGGTPPSVEEEIRLYRTGVFPAAGDEITDGELLGPVLVDGFVNVFPVAPLEIAVEPDETIVVALELANDSAPPFGPGPVHDGDGCQRDRNAVLVLPERAWEDACALQVSGDWVIRAVVDCAVPCRGDLDGSGVVDFGDVLLVLARWGPCEDCPEDLDDSGEIDFIDVLIVLGEWGACGG